MQALSIIFSNREYGNDMPAGRPSTRPRTSFGERLVTAREAAGLSQAQVAAKLGITQHAYAYWERHPVALRPEQLAQLAEVLKTGVEELVHVNGNSKRSGGPSGKARRLFEAVSHLPRRQQKKIFDILTPFVVQQGNNYRKAA